MKGQFDSDTNALIQRENFNKSAFYDLEEWMFKQVKLDKVRSVLDLGCGTGKQIFALHKLLPSESRIVGADISSDAIRIINERANKENISTIQAKVCALDDVSDFFKDSSFDLILSAYAIYYSKNIVKLLSSLAHLLNKNGQVFVCGYGKGTNQEIYQLISKFQSTDYSKTELKNDFINEEDIKETARHYSFYRVERLSNKVMFSSPQDVLFWWTNHNSYVEEIHEDVSNALNEYFLENQVFYLTKNVLGVLYES
jgi:ubiquinone/menaquinone biosynthesis C-methylase UbiE